MKRNKCVVLLSILAVWLSTAASVFAAFGPSLNSMTGPSNNTYGAGQDLIFKVTFSASVTVHGSPSISLRIGSSTRTADYDSADSGGAVVAFKYTVASGDSDSNGISFQSTSISLGGSDSIKDSSNRSASTSFFSHQPNLSQVFVDAVGPAISIGSPSPSATASGPVTFTVTYTDPNFNASTLSVSDITLSHTGDAAAGSTNVIINGSSATVTLSSITGNGTLRISSIASGTASDTLGNTSPSAGSSSSFTVDNTPPTITNVTPFLNGTYKLGDIIYLDVYLSESVTVDTSGGAPSFQVTLDSGAVTPAYFFYSTSGPHLVFAYQVQSGDLDTDGIAWTGPLSLNGATIKDAAGNDLDTSFDPGSASGVKVDGVAPYSVSVTPPAPGSYGVGAHLDYTVTWNENVDATGSTSSIRITVGSTQRDAVLISGNHTSVFTYRYTVQAGETDSNGITTPSSIHLPGGSHLRDAAGNDANASLGSVDTSLVYVDTTAPAAPILTGISPDNGSSSTDNNTSSQNLSLNGTAETNSTVTVTLVGTGVIGTTSADVSGNWTFDYTGTTLAEGTYQFTATATDAAGNVSAASNPLTVVVDLTAPAAPVITHISPDSGYSATDGITTNQNLKILGTAETNSTVTICLSGTGTIGTATANASGDWCFDYTGTTLEEGCYFFKASVADVAGNTGPNSDSFKAVVDLTPPAINISTPPSLVPQGTPISYTVTYSDDHFYIGTLSPSDVTVHAIGAHGTVDVTGSDTTYTVTINNVGGVGTLSISIAPGTASDAAGNLAPGISETPAVSVVRVAKIMKVAGTASGKFKAGDSVMLTVQFNTKVTVDTESGTPSLCLDSGGTAYYVSGSHSKTLNFSYTIQPGENSADLDYVSVTSLKLNGASIYYEGTTEPVSLDLPAPGSVNSLSASGNIDVDTAGPAISISDPSTVATVSGPVTYTVTYTDRNFTSSSLSATDVSLITSGDATGTVSVDSGTGTNRTVTISDITGNGTIGIKIGPNSAVDILGNQSACSDPSATFLVGPEISIVPALNLTTAAIFTPFSAIGDLSANQINIHGSANTTYTIESATNLTTPDWQNLGTITTDGNGYGTFTDDTGSEGDSRFYRTSIQLDQP